MDKRGISAVVATVLIVLITVVSIGILWFGILPLLGVDIVNPTTSLKIVLMDGYTVYDPAQHFAFVQVARGEDQVDLVSLEIIFSINGSSVKYHTRTAPASDGRKTYTFNFTRDGLVGEPDFVSVSPIIRKGTSLKVGEIQDRVRMPKKTAKITWEEDRNSEDMYGECEDGEFFYRGGCAIDVNKMIVLNLNQEGRVYVLTGDLNVDGDGILISASNIDLEGRGYNLVGSGSGSGIYTSDSSGLVGLSIRNFAGIRNFQKAVYLKRVDNSLIEGNILGNSDSWSSLRSGVIFNDCSLNDVRNNIIYSSGSGIIFEGGTYLKYNGNNIEGNLINIHSDLINSVDGFFVILSMYGEFKSNSIKTNIININSLNGDGVCFKSYYSNISLNKIEYNEFNINASISGKGISFENIQGPSIGNLFSENVFRVISPLAYGVDLSTTVGYPNPLPFTGVLQNNNACGVVGGDGFYCSDVAGMTGTGNLGSGSCPGVTISPCT